MTDTRYEANEQDALDWVFDNLDVDDPSDEILERAIEKGIEYALAEVRRHLFEKKSELIAEAREIFDKCLEDDEEWGGPPW